MDRVVVVCAAGALWLAAGCQSPGLPSADTPASNGGVAGPVRAMGNEPGWVVDIAATEIRLILDYGDRRLSAPVAVPERGIGGRSVAGETPPTLEFTAGGGLSGSGSCNRYAGSYALSGEGLSISGVAATRMACAEPTMNQEQRFFAALSAVYRFEIAADGSLILHAVDGRSISATR
jgi:heat shock protein HslJ